LLTGRPSFVEPVAAALLAAGLCGEAVLADGGLRGATAVAAMAVAAVSCCGAMGTLGLSGATGAAALATAAVPCGSLVSTTTLSGGMSARGAAVTTAAAWSGVLDAAIAALLVTFTPVVRPKFDALLMADSEAGKGPAPVRGVSASTLPVTCVAASRRTPTSTGPCALHSGCATTTTWSGANAQRAISGPVHRRNTQPTPPHPHTPVPK